MYIDAQWLVEYTRNNTSFDESMPPPRMKLPRMLWFSKHLRHITGVQSLTYMNIVDKRTPPNAVVLDEADGSQSHMIIA